MARAAPCSRSARSRTRAASTKGLSADVVVIGGGALGAATAFHLRRLGVHDVVLVERDALASGSTSKSAGGIRAQFADELNIRIALRSLAEFEGMGDEIAFRRHGYRVQEVGGRGRADGGVDLVLVRDGETTVGFALTASRAPREGAETP